MIGFIVFIISIAVFLGAGLALAAGLKRMGVIGPGAGTGTAPGTRQELDRIHDALALLESRIETLQEEQRFVERLLADRGSGRELPAGGGGEEAGGVSEAEKGILFETEER